MTSQDPEKHLLHPSEIKDNPQLTLPPSTIDFAQPNSDLIRHLTEQNKKLQEENTKFQTKIISLEKNIRQSNLTNSPSSITDTSHKFQLPSQILDKWTTIAKNDINSCFIEFFSYPEITGHLVQEMFFIMQKMLKDKINTAIQKTLHLFGIEINTNTNDDISKFLFKIVKPFLQEFYYEIFINENSKQVSAFNNAFISNFTSFYTNEIIPLLQLNSLNVNNNNSNSNSDITYSVNTITQSQSFRTMLLNVKEVLLYFELSNQQLVLHIDSFTTRELAYMENNTKENVINVNGKILPNQKQLILLNPPMYIEGGKPHPKYQKIILAFDTEDGNIRKHFYSSNFDSNLHTNNQLYPIPNSNSTKNVTATPGLSLRSGSYQNIYNFTTEQENEFDEEEINMNSYLNNFMIHHTKANTHLINNHEILFDNSISPLTTDNNNNNGTGDNSNNKNNKLRTERVQQTHDDYSNITLFNSFLTRKTHTRSLSKQSTIKNDRIATSNNNNTNSNQQCKGMQNKIDSAKNNSNPKKAKIFRLKRKGKEFHLEEISTNMKPYMFNINLNQNMIYKNYKTKSNHHNHNYMNYVTSQQYYHRHHNSNHNLSNKRFKYSNLIGNNNPNAFIKTNTNTNANNNKSVHGKSAKTLNGNRSSKGNNGIVVRKKKPVGYANAYHKKNSSLEKNVIENKTNAFTKMDVDRLLSIKNKKQLVELRKTFAQPNVNMQQVWNE